MHQKHLALMCSLGLKSGFAEAGGPHNKISKRLNKVPRDRVIKARLRGVMSQEAGKDLFNGKAALAASLLKESLGGIGAGIAS